MTIGCATQPLRFCPDAIAAVGRTVGCKTEPFSFCPQNPVTLAEMATFLARAPGMI